ncbi:uncharacterized protein TNCV_4436481 [Trichonephila clavipes]|nr:uncharacterized protein TNCV_4436481 [Trichonephila clavipes]
MSISSCNHMCFHSCNGYHEPFFSKTMLGFTQQGCHKNIFALLLPFLGLPYPADLTPIEHIWDNLGQRVRHPTSLNELQARLQQVWNEMSQDITQSLYASMADHIASCIRARGVQQGIKLSVLLPFSLK